MYRKKEDIGLTERLIFGPRPVERRDLYSMPARDTPETRPRDKDVPFVQDFEKSFLAFKVLLHTHTHKPRMCSAPVPTLLMGL